MKCNLRSFFHVIAEKLREKATNFLERNIENHMRISTQVNIDDGNSVSYTIQCDRVRKAIIPTVLEKYPLSRINVLIFDACIDSYRNILASKEISAKILIKADENFNEEKIEWLKFTPSYKKGLIEVRKIEDKNAETPVFIAHDMYNPESKFNFCVFPTVKEHCEVAFNIKSLTTIIIDKFTKLFEKGTPLFVNSGENNNDQVH